MQSFEKSLGKLVPFCLVGALAWLIFLGQWLAVAYACVGFVAPLIIIITVGPGMLIGQAAARRRAQGARLALPLLLLANLWTAAIPTVWCMGVLTVLLNRAAPATWIPLLLLSFALGTGPFVFLASKIPIENRSNASRVSLFAIQSAFLVIVVFIGFSQPVELITPWLIFGSVMGVQALVATFHPAA